MSDVPVIAIDGPGGAGKGAISRRVARSLGWHLLDSGALYRLIGLEAVRKGVDLADETQKPGFHGLLLCFRPSLRGLGASLKEL